MPVRQNKSVTDAVNTVLRGLNALQFKALGDKQIGYIRPGLTSDGQRVFTVHSADGSLLNIGADYNAALEALQSFQLDPVTVH